MITTGREYAVDARWLRELAMFSSRGYTTGMFFGKQPDQDYNFDGESYRMSHELVGIIVAKQGEEATVALRNRLDTHDPIEFLSPGIEERLFTVGNMKDGEGNHLHSARNEDIIVMNVPQEARVNDLIRRQKNFRSAKAEEPVIPRRT
jgi:putative protease